MKRGGGLSGAVSLVMIFCVLCLSVFAVLTVATSDRERRLSELAAERTAEYYAADAEATRIVAALAQGETPDTEIPINRADVSSVIGQRNELVFFSVPAGGEQELQVRVQLHDGEVSILRWATAYTGEWTSDDSITLFDPFGDGPVF